MPIYEYSVIPAPARGAKAKDAKTPGDRFAATLTDELNRMARDGWEFVRADVLPCEERSGLTGRVTVYHNLLVFRRPLAQPGTAQTDYPVVAAHQTQSIEGGTSPEQQGTAPIAPADTGTDEGQAAAR